MQLVVDSTRFKVFGVGE
jgi:hypothetical protein